MKKFFKRPAVMFVGAVLAYLALNGLTTHWDDQGNHPVKVRQTYQLTT